MTETHLLWIAGDEVSGQGELYVIHEIAVLPTLADGSRIPVQDPATGETFAL